MIGINGVTNPAIIFSPFDLFFSLFLRKEKKEYNLKHACHFLNNKKKKAKNLKNYLIEVKERNQSLNYYYFFHFHFVKEQKEHKNRLK